MPSPLQVRFFLSNRISWMLRTCSRKKFYILLCILAVSVLHTTISHQFSIGNKPYYMNGSINEGNISRVGKPDWNVTAATISTLHNNTAVKNKTWIDPDVRFFLNPSHICSPRSESNQTTKILLTVVHTARENFNERSILRNTYGSVKSYRGWSLPVLFIVGIDMDPNSSNATKTDARLNEEFHKHNDLILADFIDTYKNLSFKHLVALHWATKYCPQASFYLKTDDDYIIEIFQVVNLISTISAHDTSFYCSLAKGWTPFRDPMNKNFVSVEDFPGGIFPEFCNGMLITRMSTLKKILKINQRKQVKYLDMEDVFISGILRMTWNNQTGIPDSKKIKITTGNVRGHLTPKELIDQEIAKKRLTEIPTDRFSSRTCELWRKILNVHGLQNNYTTVLGC